MTASGHEAPVRAIDGASFSPGQKKKLRLNFSPVGMTLLKKDVAAQVLVMVPVDMRGRLAVKAKELVGLRP